MGVYQYMMSDRRDVLLDAHACRKETGPGAQGGAGGKRRQESSSVSDKDSSMSDKGRDGSRTGGVDGVAAWCKPGCRPGSSASSTSSPAQPASTSSAGLGATSGQALARSREHQHPGRLQPVQAAQAADASPVSAPPPEPAAVSRGPGPKPSAPSTSQTADAPLTFNRQQLSVIESIYLDSKGMSHEDVTRRCAAALSMTLQVPFCVVFGFVALGLCMPPCARPGSLTHTHTHTHILLALFIAPLFCCLVFLRIVFAYSRGCRMQCMVREAVHCWGGSV